MPKLIVTRLGTQDHQHIEAANDYHAVAVAADCALNDVPLPIWQEAEVSWRQRGARCYVPNDNTGRQWLVHDDTESKPRK